MCVLRNCYTIIESMLNVSVVINTQIQFAKMK